MHRPALDLPAPVDGRLAVLGARGKALLEGLPCQELRLPRLVRRDGALKAAVLPAHLHLLQPAGTSGPDLVLVAGNHLVQDAAATGTSDAGAQHHLGVPALEWRPASGGARGAAEGRLQRGAAVG